MDLSGAFQCIMHSLFPHAQIICDRFHYIRLVGQNFIHSRFDAYSFIRYQLYDGRKLSNGPIEERNRIVKIILRLANGYTNFNRFRNRVLYVYMTGGESHSVRYMRATTKPLVRATSSDKRASPYRLAS